MTEGITTGSGPAPRLPADAEAAVLAPLSMRQKSLFACGDIADGIKNVALAQFLLFYLTAVMGLSGSLAGLALAIALIIDAITDPIVGYISDTTRSRWGRRHLYMFGAAPPLALAVGLIFSVPRFETTWALFTYVLGVLLLLRVSFSAFILPYAAMGAELSKDYQERSVIMTYRIFFNMCANVSCVVLGFGIFMSGDNLLNREAYIPFGWVIATIVLVGALVSATGTLPLRHRLQRMPQEPAPSVARILRELGDVFHNRSFILLFLTIVVFWVAQGTAGSLGVHAFRFFWSLPTQSIQNLLIVQTTGLALGIPLCALLLRFLEKKQISAACLAVICLCQAIPASVAILGFAPPTGPMLLAFLACFHFLIGLSLTNLAITFGSMMADAADEHDLLFGSRREALYFAGLTFGGKCALGVGAFVAGVALDLIGFPTDLASRPEQTISDLTLLKLGLIYGPGAALISFAAVAILMRYRLDSREHARIQRELGQRNVSASAPLRRPRPDQPDRTPSAARGDF
jgi:glycoside/pentoside/hexuronide:cation symporter, GPH family